MYKACPMATTASRAPLWHTKRLLPRRRVSTQALDRVRLSPRPPGRAVLPRHHLEPGRVAGPLLDAPLDEVALAEQLEHVVDLGREGRWR